MARSAWAYIGIEAMKMMVNKELVVGIPNIMLHKERCTSCLLGKQMRKVFPQATSYRATRILDLIHGDLCGPISHSTAAPKTNIFLC